MKIISMPGQRIIPVRISDTGLRIHGKGQYVAIINSTPETLHSDTTVEDWNIVFVRAT